MKRRDAICNLECIKMLHFHKFYGREPINMTWKCDLAFSFERWRLLIFYEPCKSIRRRICFVVVLKANSGKTMLKIITNVQKACYDGKKCPIVWLQMSDCRKSKTLTHFMGEGYRLLHYERQEDLCFEIQNTSMMRRWGENWRK